MGNNKILGLDLGTNSIGWAVVNTDDDLKPVSIEKAGSRIIPLDAATMGDFERGNSVSKTKDRTFSRGVRRLFQRRALRRERLNRVLFIIGALPQHYSSHLNRYGNLIKGEEPKIAWQQVDGKWQFLFPNSFTEMTNDFRRLHPDIRLPYDWTVYFLRKKALTEKISLHELAWVLQQFNQKRGYNQTRAEAAEEAERNTERKEYRSLRVVDVRDAGENKKDKRGGHWYEVEFENGWVYMRTYPQMPDLTGKMMDIIATTKLNPDGTDKLDKDGKVRRSFSAPKEDDWGLLKVKTECDIDQSGKTVGEYIYDALLADPDQKIIGKLVRVVDRRYYHDELHRIVNTQIKFHPELQDRDLYRQCIEALYPANDAYRTSIANRDFEYLLADDIVLFQRPLKSKKSLISECPHEYHSYTDKNGERHRQYLKCIPKSHPMYEEFRVLQFIYNLHIYRLAANGITRTECSEDYLKDLKPLFEWLMQQKKVNSDALMKFLDKKNCKSLSWNYVDDKEYPMAPVTSLLTKALADNGGNATGVNIEAVWHILYSVSDRQQLAVSLANYAAKNNLRQGFVDSLKNQKPFAADYGAYSLKATRRLLSLMRFGDYWREDSIDDKTKARIENILNGEFDDRITDTVREKCAAMRSIGDFRGLPLWLAEYVVYGVRVDDTRWTDPGDIDKYIQSFRLHSLNNPIVEQVVMESLRTVRDIWRQYGKPVEIHLEMGRELKKNAAERLEIQQRQMENERANLRARIMLRELMNMNEIEGVRAYSPSQLDLFRIFEDGILSNELPPDDVQKIINDMSSAKTPTEAEVRKYRLWLEQRYVSPYTGQVIPLSRLFTPAYEIEHIIPQSRYFDDSMSNKVICEAEVNKLKDRMLAHEFIAKMGGTKVRLSGKAVPVEVLSLAGYEKLVRDRFRGGKRQKLMLDDIPETFIARQMNDSRYIARLMRSLLNRIVMPEDAKADDMGNRVVVCSGQVTDRLKREWGVNDVWNHIILPRFERLDAMLGGHGTYVKIVNGHRVPTAPLEQKLEKKRLDHRHHAMDAIVIACASRNHVNLLSNEASVMNDNSNRYALSCLLRRQENMLYDGKNHVVFREFLRPWDTFQYDVEKSIREIIVSFKQNTRILTKGVNRYAVIEDGMKKTRRQEGEMYSVRKSLHKDTVFGLVNLRFKKSVTLKVALGNINDIVNRDLRAKLKEMVAEGKNEKQIKAYFTAQHDAWSDVNLSKIEIYYYTNDTPNERCYATRKAIDASFDRKAIEGSVADTGIQKILLRHLEENGNDPEKAFSPEGIVRMNENITHLNNGVPHKPILKVRKYELANKFAVGHVGNKGKKFVEGAKGTNLFFAIYENEDKTREYFSIPLRMVVKSMLNGNGDWMKLADAEIKKMGEVSEDAILKCVLSPGDLVSVPDCHDSMDADNVGSKLIYKFVSCDLQNAYFVPQSFASSIVDKVEFTKLNKIPRTEDGRLIRDVCEHIVIDRLGNIVDKEK